MNRVHRFLWGLGAGQLSSGVNILYTAASVPLALAFLNKEQFGLWALVTQIGGYLMLLDIGMSASVTRFLADHKDSKDEGTYGSILSTGQLIFLIQAFLIALLATVCACLLPSFLEIPANMWGDFRKLLVGQGLILAIGLALRSKGAPLWAHQRVDLIHLAASANLLTALAGLGAGLWLGLGTDSFLLAGFLGALWTWFFPWAACHHFRLFPKFNSHRGFHKDLFLRMFSFGRDMLLVQLGGLLCTGSQIIIISKILGLEAAATFAVATKTLVLGQQLLGRIFEGAAPGLTELFVQGRRDRFVQRFYEMAALSLSLATILAVCLAAGNSTFVLLWTSGAIQWSQGGDNLLGATLITTIAGRCFLGLFGLSAELYRVRYLPLAEGLLFVGLALALGVRLGLEGILIAGLAAHALVTFARSFFLARTLYPPGNAYSRVWGVVPFTFLLGVVANFFVLPTPLKPRWVLMYAGTLGFLAGLFLWLSLRRVFARLPSILSESNFQREFSRR